MWLHVFYLPFSSTPAGTPDEEAPAAPELGRQLQQCGGDEWLLVRGPELLELYLACNARTAVAAAPGVKKIHAVLQPLLAGAATGPVTALQAGEAAAHFLRSALGGMPGGHVQQQHAVALRKAFATAQENGHVGVLLNRLFQRALWLSEKVRSETAWYEGTTALAPAIIEVTGKIFGTLRDRQALLIGSTAEAIATAQALQQAGLGRFCFVAADAREEMRMSRTLPAAVPVPLENGNSLPRVDLILIFSVPPSVVEGKLLSRLITQRQHATLLLADLTAELAGEALAKADNLFYFTRADLHRILERSQPDRRAIEQKVAGWIAREAEQFLAWANSDEPFHFGAMVGSSRPMQKVFELIARVARTDITILIQGESGTGKELVARAIHDESTRARQPFVVVNCGAIPENLLESELFGHVRGAFTGALRDKKGLFEEAHTGTIFLDEIGELPVALQVKLLRFLQEGEIKRVGSNHTLLLNVRVIAATNRDLEEMVEQGRFRSDLFYRLNVIRLELPPLRERPEDIPLLARHFLQKFATRLRRPARAFTSAALARLTSYDWPGNVRELENAIERAVALSLDEEIDVLELPESLRKSAGRPLAALNGRLTLEEVEKRHILETLDYCQGNYDEAARLLAIGRTTLWRKLKKYQEEMAKPAASAALSETGPG
ncbi:MAG: sigma 54-interacting transcriptional regulator [candidate division KSB1 bacterium]|nr:sigma 54-interacting transcriptional regulator [candidate division KSB1 bacterium]MDZ7272922.1 sigma 54-interacting transcriptional regulator [candidate division KSB1 bacterium]MDZ7284056.1 sigma 54-interacting transcriptional regulator [candidate division KSB1 bacterium]MDZ7297547.1 sigma 54-interacting transcriptional regulator [candidate division KSB1 bacterium]MDZ7309173.1 sigma 54-interacting transcriptional regulator [candidate division KSB1 bacterium]